MTSLVKREHGVLEHGSGVIFKPSQTIVLIYLWLLGSLRVCFRAWSGCKDCDSLPLPFFPFRYFKGKGLEKRFGSRLGSGHEIRLIRQYNLSPCSANVAGTDFKFAHSLAVVRETRKRFSWWESLYLFRWGLIWSWMGVPRTLIWLRYEGHPPRGWEILKAFGELPAEPQAF